LILLCLLCVSVFSKSRRIRLTRSDDEGEEGEEDDDGEEEEEQGKEFNPDVAMLYRILGKGTYTVYTDQSENKTDDATVYFPTYC